MIICALHSELAHVIPRCAPPLVHNFHWEPAIELARYPFFSSLSSPLALVAGN